MNIPFVSICPVRQMSFRVVSRFALGWVLLGGAGLAVGCGGPSKYFVTGAGSAASADANIEVERLEGGNKMVRLDIQNLPPPERVAEDASVYVVWFTAEDQAPLKAGTLSFDSDERTGRLQATSAFDEFVVLVTAEESTGAGSPSSHVVIRQSVE